MALTSEDIANVSFSIDRKGYDVDEVDVFLERVADEIDALNAQIADYQAGGASVASYDSYEEDATQVMPAIDTDAIAQRDARIAELEAELDAQRSRVIELQTQLDEVPTVNDSAIAQALIVAQRSADEVLANANTQSEQILNDAREDAAKIVKDANDEKATINDEIKELETEREEARGAYQDLLRNFINDATSKLNTLQDRKEAAAARHVSPNKTGKFEPAAAQQKINPQAGFVAPAGQPQVVAETPKPSAVEKDLSGFGDADDFEFEELD